MKASKTTTQTERIRRAMKVHPDHTPKQIANQLGISPRAVHMVKYLDKKRATQAPGKPNHSPKPVASKKPQRNLSNEMDAVKQTIADIKAREPERGSPMSMWEIVVICVACIFMVEIGMRLSGVK